jgi:hypothetical protein
MTVTISLVGIGLGTLLAAAGLVLWGRHRQVRGLGQAIRSMLWLTCGVLLLATLSVWMNGSHQHALVAKLIPVAAIAAPIVGRRRSVQHDAAAMLPTLLLTGAGYCLVTSPGQPEPHSFELTLVDPVLIICAGLAVRVVSEALSLQVDPATPPSRLFDALYVLFTLLVGGNTLLTLWQQGVVGKENPTELGLVGVWLVWTGAWLSARSRPRLRAALIAGAALVLNLMVLGAV